MAVKTPNASTGSGTSLSKKKTTKDGGVNSEGAVDGAIAAFKKKKGSMSSSQRKKVAARLKSLKQQQGKKGVLSGE